MLELTFQKVLALSQAYIVIILLILTSCGSDGFQRWVCDQNLASQIILSSCGFRNTLMTNERQIGTSTGAGGEEGFSLCWGYSME